MAVPVLIVLHRFITETGSLPGMEPIFRTKYSFVPISHVWVFYVGKNPWILCSAWK